MSFRPLYKIRDWMPSVKYLDYDELIENEQYEFNHYYEININTNCYFRAETESMNYRGKCIAITNPIWFNP